MVSCHLTALNEQEQTLTLKFNMVHQVEQQAKHTKQILIVLGKLDKKLDDSSKKAAMQLLYSYCNQIVYEERTYNIRLT